MTVATVVAVGALPSTPAAASPLQECFERVAVAIGHAPQRAKPHAPRKAAPHRVHRVRAAGARPAKRAAVHASRVAYAMRPRACEVHEAAPIITPAPGVAAEAPAGDLLAYLVGPAIADDAAVDAAAAAPGLPPFTADDGGGFIDLTPPNGGDGGGVIIPGPGPTGAIPEPSTWAMLLVGFFGLGGALRRQARRRAAA